VFDLGDVEGPEKKRRGDGVTGGRRDQDIRVSGYQDIGTSEREAYKMGRHGDAVMEGFLNSTNPSDTSNVLKHLPLITTSFQAAKRVAQGVVFLPRIES
jgi:hypothetical protein